MAARTGVVQVSGRGSNVDFTIDDSAPFNQIAKGLRDYLVENRGLWSKGTIGVNAGRWLLSEDQLALIKHIIETESGLTVGRFWSPPSRLEAASAGTSPNSPEAQLGNNGSSGRHLVHNAADAPEETSEPCVEFSGELQVESSSEIDFGPLQIEHPKPKPSKAGSSRKGEPTEALFVKTTFRSGESINYHGDVIVLADVNPGAEIIAEGDIVVFGSLRGMAHAGSAGDTRATIIALELDSPRIQIGPYTGLAPGQKSNSKSGSKSLRNGPKIAYSRRRSVYVSPYAGRFARYSRGTLYDG